ncbi:Uncharacterised protein [Klebsiella pneumoniae]|nr:Uncharacterised protein [Klebsiella pneumoniae]
MTRFARRYSAHPWASPLRGQRRRCSKTLPAFLSGQPARRLAVCPTGVASCRTPVGDSHPPRWVPHAKKKPVLAYELFLKYGGEGGIDSLRSPLRGSPLAGSRSVQLALPVVEPRSGVLIPPCGEYKRKEPVLAYELFLKYGGEGGIDSLRSPLRGSPLTACAVCPTGCASCQTPVGGSHPPLRRI